MDVASAHNILPHLKNIICGRTHINKALMENVALKGQ